jgi:hypothetical protein
MKSDPKDVQIPLVLVVLGFLLFAITGYRLSGAGGPAVMMAYIGVATVLGTILMIAAAFVTAKLIGASFGELSTASLKLAAIYIFPAAIGSLMPFGGFLAFFIWLGLLLWLFELEVYQAVVFAIVLWVVNFLVGLLLVGILR